MKMADITQEVAKIRYKTIEFPELTRGIAKDSTELIGNTPLVRLNRIIEGAKAEMRIKAVQAVPIMGGWYCDDKAAFTAGKVEIDHYLVRGEPQTPGFKEVREVGHGAGVILHLEQRMDGFVSADADYRGGTLTTGEVTCTGDHLVLNLDTGALGCARVGILDAQGRPIPGFSARDCDPVRTNSTGAQITWEGSPDISALRDRVVKLRFLMQSCKLYSARFAESTSGEVSCVER